MWQYSQRNAARRRTRFIGAAQISVSQLEGEDGAGRYGAPRFVVGSDSSFEDSAFGIGYRVHAFYLTQPRALLNRATSFTGVAITAHCRGRGLRL